MVLVGAFFMACNIKKDEKGELPEVDIDVDTEAGNLP
jgi:hypothetical protein